MIIKIEDFYFDTESKKQVTKPKKFRGTELKPETNSNLNYLKAILNAEYYCNDKTLYYLNLTDHPNTGTILLSDFDRVYNVVSYSEKDIVLKLGTELKDDNILKVNYNSLKVDITDLNETDKLEYYKRNLDYLLDEQSGMIIDTDFNYRIIQALLLKPDMYFAVPYFKMKYNPDKYKDRLWGIINVEKALSMDKKYITNSIKADSMFYEVANAVQDNENSFYFLQLFWYCTYIDSSKSYLIRDYLSDINIPTKRKHRTL